MLLTERMYLVLDTEQPVVSASYADVGADGLDKGRQAVLEAVAGGTALNFAIPGKDHPNVTFTILDGTVDALR